jgi:GGDEF domain-containing protein
MSDAVAPPSPARALVTEPDPGLNDARSDTRPGPDDWIALLHKAAADSPGIDVIYELLALVAQRFGLEDAVLAVPNETLGTQIFRLSRQAIGQAELARILDGAGFVSTPDVVPLGAQRLVTGIAEVALATHLAQRHVVRDPTTGLLSRQVFNEALRAAAAQSSRYGWTFTVMVLRVKGVAEQLGDGEVRRLGYAFGRALRSGDTGGRLYRSTFTALLPNASAESLHALVHRFAEESGLRRDAIGYGSATTPNDSVDPAELFRLAGSRLHDA